MPRYRTPTLTFSLEEALDIRRSLARRFNLSASTIRDWHWVRKSLDVRHKNPKFQGVIDLDLTAETKDLSLSPDPFIPVFPRPRDSACRVAVIGAGPAGLFAALTLIKAGLRPDIYERGKPVERRARDVAALMHTGNVNHESNICFGEGGAGAYSDGKLMTRTKSEYIPHILSRFIEFGGAPEIAYEAHPHIGTDKLAPILKNMRAHLESNGATYHFDTTIEDLWIEDGICRGIVINGSPIPYDAVFLCIGHSADDLYVRLHDRVVMQPKPLAIGFRVEHPQALINAIQYGKYANHPLLPAAEYAVRFNDDTLPSAFSFCMCPGGHIVASQTTADTRVVNGMSGSARNGRYANAAIVAQVGPEDYLPGPLGGLEWIRNIERKAAEGMPPGIAPAQRLLDFLDDKTSASLPTVSYEPGVQSRNLNTILPPKIARTLRTAFKTFDRQMHGFITQEANLIGVETRTSSPVRILRTAEYTSPTAQNLYPLGEGAGYAGGITSCALDGLNGVLAFLQKLT